MQPFTGLLDSSHAPTQHKPKGPFGCLYSQAWHCIGLNVNTIGYLHWDSMPIFSFGCLYIWCPQLISRLNVKSCLDGQSDELHSYENLIVIHVQKCIF
jgi:hypothetical protein